MIYVQRTLLFASLATALTACNARVGSETPEDALAQDVSVAVDPQEATIAAEDTLGFTATVTGSAVTAVSWTVVETGGGTIDAQGVYTAPASPGTFHVRATSVASPSVSGESTVVVAAPVAVAVAIAPRTTSVVASGTVTFTATVTNTMNTAVTWSVPTAGCGTVTAAGVYTAPSTARTCTVVATSQADPSKSDTATVTVTAPVTVAISPSTTSVTASGTVQFTATVTNAMNTAVTWSVPTAGCGTVTAAGLYTAPATARTCTVVATSQADTTRSATATVTVTAPIVVAVTPSSAATNGCRSVTFSATVTGSADTAVVWSVLEGAAGGTVTAQGVYTAPATAGTYHVVATSHANPARSASAAVTVTDQIISVAVSPATITLQPGGTAQFTATVTTSCGTTTTNGTVVSAGNELVVVQ